ncbi:MAG: DUF1028 domain-containing protein [Actinomycetota bacterium]
MTFSIVAHDGRADPPEWGVAVASKFLSVGAIVPWARAGAGAIATQAFANLAYGDAGLRRLERGESAEEVVAALTGADGMRARRQLGVVDAQGGAANFTGEECFEWAGDRTGAGFACQGNILTGPEVVDEMARVWQSSDGDLGQRLLSALDAGDRAGGDRRGRQAAALFLVRAGGGYFGGTDAAVDLRVDDHEQPVGELRRLFGIHRMMFPRPGDLEFIAVDAGLARRVREALETLGYDAGSGEGYDDELKSTLWEFVGVENYEERWSDDPKIDRAVLGHLFDKAQQP